MKNKKLQSAALITTCLTLCFTLCSCFFFKFDDEEGAEAGDMKLVWSDEFEYIGKPDTSKWKYQTGHGVNGWGNNELQNYIDNTNTADTAIVEDGHLKIKAYYDKGEWKSARMNSKASWTNGYIEARLKVTNKRGAWPAFWMMPDNYSSSNPWPDCGEIDIMENAPSTAGENVVFSSLHAKGHHTNNPKSIGRKNFGSSFGNEWHTFAIKWDQKKITAYYDGEAMDSYINDGTGLVNWPYTSNFYIILNLAIGGNLGNSDDAAKLQGSEVEFLVDYVRVYQ